MFAKIKSVNTFKNHLVVLNWFGVSQLIIAVCNMIPQ